jgi:hypothetical protein
MAYTVTVSSIWQTPMAQAWTLLQQPTTFYFVAAPILVAKPIGDIAKKTSWQIGDIATFQLFLFGFLPFGKHTICIKNANIDPCFIQTDEKSVHYTFWQHTLQLDTITANSCRYTDIIVFAPRFFGFLQPLIVQQFFKHRHRRWQKLLQINNNISYPIFNI